jgi:hypothetical protein
MTRITAFLVAGVLFGFVSLATPSPASAQSPTTMRTGMTWTVLNQQNGYVHVGTDAQTNVYAGDTKIDQYLPILCLLVNNQAAPSGISFDYYTGWARGAVQATASIRGSALTSQQQADTICAATFGAGWRMAEFHDGRYGAGFSATGGWSYWAAGTSIPGTRFWVAISDQPANPWNSAGDVPPPDTTSNQDIALKTRLQELMAPLLTFSQSSLFRDLVYTGVGRRFDGDDNVLLSDVVREAEQTQIVNTSSPAWQALKAKIAQFQNLNGQSYDPQIYIPNFQDGAVRDPDVTMVALETDLRRTQLPAYQLDANGNPRLTAAPIDESYAEAHEVWVVSVHENVGSSSSSLATTIGGKRLTARKPRRAVPPVEISTKGITCNPTGLRNNNGLEYLQQFKVPNPSSVEHWTSGKLEVRLIVVGKGGAEIKNAYFGKIKRKDVKNWVVKDLLLTTWDRAVWGDYFAYKWVEEDNGPTIEISLGLSNFVKSLLGLPFTANVKATFESKHDDMGSGVVGFSESTYSAYSTGTVDWNVCSVGGDGHTGNDNLALAALASASTTFSGYSAARVNDGSQSTALGGGSSWANAANTALPQWVQLDFGTNKTFSRVVLYTTSGYPLQDYRIQSFNNVFGWQDLVPGVVNNTATTRTHTFSPTTARLVRVLALRGPSNQLGYVRVNEFEVYP